MKIKKNFLSELWRGFIQIFKEEFEGTKKLFGPKDETHVMMDDEAARYRNRYKSWITL